MRHPPCTAAAVAVLLLAGSLVGPPPAAAAPGVVTAAASVFVPAEVVIPQGAGLTFVNFDIDAKQEPVFHNLVSDGDGSFGSDTVWGGAFPVNGVEDLTPNTYPFKCTLHDGMIGNLTVVGP